jgi:MFS transporter, NNP family, nitrate/nitrite transporter
MVKWNPFRRSARSADPAAESALHATHHLSGPNDDLTLWQTLTTLRVNPKNGKCTTLPMFDLRSPYARNFHLSWLGFWAAFLSWFAFSPLVPEAIRTDLKLTQKQIGNSNIVSLCATLLVRIIVGPLVDRFGPRKVMAGLLILGAIPSGLAGTISTPGGLYTVRFFIGILGGTFVPCQSWTTTFYDTNIVGRANALVGGWGNSGGGFTFIIMVGLYNQLISDGLTPHKAWRAAFAIVPVPILLFVAMLILVFGTDHPNGKWSDRHKPINASLASAGAGVNEESHAPSMADDKGDIEKKEGVDVDVHNVAADDVDDHHGHFAVTSLSNAKESQNVSWAIVKEVCLNPLTWLPALAYMCTFGYELAIDANLANVLFGLYNPTHHTFGQTKAGYVRPLTACSWRLSTDIHR